LRVTFVSAEEVFQRALAAREKFFAIDPTAAARNPFVSENNASVALEASARGFRQENLEVGRSHLESCVLLWQMTPSPSRTEELLNSCAAVVSLLDRNSPTEWIEGFHLLSETALWLEISRRRNALLPAQERWSTFVSAALESWDDAMAEAIAELPALTESERVSWLSGDYAALWSAAAADPQRLPVVLTLLDREARAAAGAAPWLRKKIRERWKAGWNKPPNREERRKTVEAWCSAQNEFPQPEAADKDTVMTQIGKALLDELFRDEEPGAGR